jgi:hypothetical protein
MYLSVVAEYRTILQQLLICTIQRKHMRHSQRPQVPLNCTASPFLSMSFHQLGGFGPDIRACVIGFGFDSQLPNYQLTKLPNYLVRSRSLRRNENKILVTARTTGLITGVMLLAPDIPAILTANVPYTSLCKGCSAYSRNYPGLGLWALAELRTRK